MEISIRVWLVTKLAALPLFAVLPSDNVPSGTVLVCEAEMVCEADFLGMCGIPWIPSGKLVALVSIEDLCSRIGWVHSAAEGCRSQYLVHQAAGEKFVAIEWSEDHPSA